MQKYMTAVVAVSTGGPDVLEPKQLPTIWPADPTSVLVRLSAASVNPADVYFREQGGYIVRGGPLLLGHEAAGTVEEVGPEVVDVKPGDRVCFCYGGIGGTTGAYAQFAVVPADVIVVLPQQVNFFVAAALPLVYITRAESLYDRADVKPDEAVLIHAGAGGTGHIGVQLAKLRGARVMTTVSIERKAAAARSLGADLTVPYRDQDFVAAAMSWTAGRGLDVALDNVGQAVMLPTFNAMAPYGRVVTSTGTPGDTPETAAYNGNLTIHNVMMLTPMWKGLVERLRAQAAHVRKGLALVAEGKLRVIVDRVFPLLEAPAAHRYLASRKAIGKIVLSI